MDENLPLQTVETSLGRVNVVDQFRGVLVVLSVIAVLLPSAMGEWSPRLGLDGIQRQLEPSIWHGCTLFDLVKTSFLFVAGISTSLSVSRRRQQGETNLTVVKHLALRCLFLFLLGLVIDGGVLTLRWPWRLCGCFQQIAICQFVTGVVELLFGRTIAFLVAGMLLLNYGLALEMAPIEQDPLAIQRNETATDLFSMSQNLAAQIDRQFLSGRKYFGVWDPQGLFVTLPALAITLIGAGVASFVSRRKASAGWVDSWGKVAFAGLGVLQGGVYLARWQPLNVWLLTPPFVFVVVGASLLAIGILAGIEYFEFQLSGLKVLSQIGNNCLVLMVVLRLIDYFAYVLLFSVCDRLGLSIVYGHSLVVLLAVFVLGAVSGRSMPAFSTFPTMTQASDAG